MNRIFTLILAILLIGTGELFAQKKNKPQETSVLFTEGKFTSICEGTELDGSQMVRAYGKGKDKKDAVKQLEKNAMNDVLFNGVRDGEEGCNVAPLVNVPNAREKYKKYFNRFFSDGGQYKRYIKDKDTPEGTTRKYKSEGKEVIYTKIVTINMTKMERELTQEGIIPKEPRKQPKFKKTN